MPGRSFPWAPDLPAMNSPYAGTLKRSRASRRPRPAAGSRLVIVGNGMVGAKFCEALADEGLTEPLSVTVVGAEPRPAYDRIKLSTYVDHRNAGRLELRPAAWYAEHGIELRLGVAVTSIDRETRSLTLADGSFLSYDLLVLATGSRPFVPPIPGRDLPGVFVYRSIEDLDAIIAAATGKQSATVIGGGLLGLEAAQAVQKLGLKASVVERARFLMPAQLNEPAAGLLRKIVESQGIRLFLGKGSTEIEPESGRLRLTFDGDEQTTADLVVISAGITPATELADEAGLAVGARGGVVVNAHLETEDPAVFAIGECALLHGRIFGLAAPGFTMARHLAARLAGHKLRPLPEPDLSTRLKMLGADVVTIGNPLDEGTRHEFSTDDRYRMVIADPKGVIRGGLGVGPWEESGRVHSLFQEQAILRPAELKKFAEEGSLLTGGRQSAVPQWPDHRVVCNCMNVTKGQLVACLESCGRDPDRLAAKTEASTVCGSCRPLLEELCGEPTTGRRRPVAARSLLVVSLLALVAVLATILAPSPTTADSVESLQYRIDQLWRDRVFKQVSGYTLAGLFTIGLLFSLRKRLRWFRIGHFARWRVFHTLFGLFALVALFAHTGFRFGHNLNFWLMLVFVGLNLAGAAAGVVAAIESHGTSTAAVRARRARPVLTWLHILLFWPLPVLLTFHILSVYLY